MINSFSSGSTIGSTSSSKEALKNPTKVPCGDRELHNVMVNLAEQFETTYINCMDPNLTDEPECELSNLKPYRAVIRRLHKYTRDRNQKFVTVQYGCLDGKSNDPIYGALMKLEPRFDLKNWEGILVEPAFMDKLKKTYDMFSDTYGVDLEQMHYAEGAINTPENIDSQGKCHFYKVVPGGECPQKKEWMTQISGLSEKGLKGFFKKNFEKCVQDIQMRCWTPGQLLAEHGFNMVRSTATAPLSFNKVLTAGSEEKLYSGDVHCLDKTKQGGLQKMDLLVVDVEGYDGELVMATLNELCPELWPHVILYEDKVVRYNSGVKHHKSTIEADNIIEFLENRGYYCMLNGEDVVAMRIGYSVKDLVHTSEFELQKSLKWFHPRRGPLEDAVGA
eukprot:CAMPEP_0114424956 /NCGR_PEP_ID=MMETSP0103-20121206/6972_1 /TAXON_ID=37642 ORGANISM="Paraphysomonas imperforata, Strain PA2" /NCGR_SAMPLE_ID=MMETSP0103 /ASSEMBLY_ACC=CAM_ASM_000201 /LENGTH=389 /DNA_ID=CAMNT_0001593747 /DNA_START=189 /DNA_END=1358 /DNA_ORIENTATION=-